jgi:hypothetical protein
MNKVLLFLFFSLVIFSSKAQRFQHHLKEGHALGVGAYYTYFAKEQPAVWLVPQFTYQFNAHLNPRSIPETKLFLQAGLSVTPSQNMDNYKGSHYNLMLPGYVNPSITFWSVNAVAMQRLHVIGYLTTGLNWLPYTDTVKFSNFLQNTFIQYYTGFGVGLSYRFVSAYGQYNYIFHDITTYSKDNFREAFAGQQLHGRFFEIGLRISPLVKIFNRPNLPDQQTKSTEEAKKDKEVKQAEGAKQVAENKPTEEAKKDKKEKRLTLFTDLNWRALGAGYGSHKTISFGFGISYDF